MVSGHRGPARDGAGAPRRAGDRAAAEIRGVNVSNNYDDANPGIISITIDTDEPVAAIQADFIDQEDGRIGGAADNFVLVERFGTRLEYVTSSPVIMEPGNYDVEVAITDTDGAVTEHAGESIVYRVVAMVEDVTVDRPVIDWENRDVTVTGVLRGRWPGTGEVRPLGGVEVGFWVHWDSLEPIITAADGTFRRTFTMSGVLNTIELWYGGGLAHTRSGNRAEYTVTVAPQETRISMRVDQRHAVVGDPITGSGKVERRSSTGWVPAPGQIELWIDNGCDDSDCVFGFNNVEVAVDGTFQLRTTAQRTGYFKATVMGHLQFFSGSNARTKVVTVRPAR